MPKPLSFGKIEVNLEAEMASSRAMPKPDTPFRIALLGDLSNSAGRRAIDLARDLARRRPVLVDRDTFDEVLARHGVELQLSAGSDPATRIVIRPATLDDFHPD